MAISLQEIREALLANNAEFQRLAQEHSQYEAELERLSKQPYLSSEDRMREVSLKKKKLRVKDEMEQLIASHLYPTST